MSKIEVPGNIRLWATVVLIAVFVIGAACGAALWHALARPNHPPPMMGPIPMHALDLTPEQEEKARAIFETYRPQIDAVLEESFPKVRAVIEKVDQDLMKILNDEQKKRFEEIKAERSAGPDDMGRRGMHPPGMPHRGRHPRGDGPDLRGSKAPAPPDMPPPGDPSADAPRDPAMEAPTPGGGVSPDAPPVPPSGRPE